VVYLAGGDREGGTRHNERRLLRFGFDDLKLRNFQNCLSKTKQRECPKGVLYTCLCCCIAIGASCCVVSRGVWCRGCLIHIRRGAYALLVSTDRAMRRPQIVKRATVQGFTLSLYIPVIFRGWKNNRLLQTENSEEQNCTEFFVKFCYMLI